MSDIYTSSATRRLAEADANLEAVLNPEPATAPVGLANKISPALRQSFETSADKYGVPVDALMGMAEKDSGFDPHTRTRGMGQRSGGIIRMDDAVVAEEGPDFNRYQASSAIDAAARRMRKRLDGGMSIDDALKAHAAGSDDRAAWGPQTDEYLNDVRARSRALAQALYGADMEQPPTPSAPVEGPGIAGNAKDLALRGARGVVGFAQDLDELGRQVRPKFMTLFGDIAMKAATGKTSEEMTKSAQESLTSKLSPEMRKAMDKKWWNAEKGEFGDAWSDWRSYAGGLLESMPETIATSLPALRLAKGVYAAQLAAGATKAAAATSAATAATVAGSVSEGLLGGANTARDVREQINALPPETLRQSEAFQSLVKSGMSEDAAKASLSKDASARAFVIGSIATGAFGGMGDRVLAKIFLEGVGKVGIKGVLGNVAKNAAAEGLLEEAPQSAAQKLVENEEVGRVDPSRPLTEGVANEAVGGAVLGGMMGGGMGAAASQAGAARQSEPGAIDAFLAKAEAERRPQINQPPDYYVNSEGTATPPAGPPGPGEPGGAQHMRAAPGVEGSVEVAQPEAQNSANFGKTTQAPSAASTASPPEMQSAPPAPSTTQPPIATSPPPAGPLSRALDTGAPEMNIAARPAGSRVMVTDSLGTMAGTIVSSDADGVLFKNEDDGKESLILPAEIQSGKIKIDDISEEAMPSAATPEPPAAPRSVQSAEAATPTIAGPAGKPQTPSDIDYDQLRRLIFDAAQKAKEATTDQERAAWRKTRMDLDRELLTRDPKTGKKRTGKDQEKIEALGRVPYGTEKAASAVISSKGMGPTHQSVARGGKFYITPINESASPPPVAAKTDAPAKAQKFAPETGTLGIPRADMPQVPSQSHGGLVHHLNANGIAHETTAVDAGALKPTQAESIPEKVEAAKDEGESINAAEKGKESPPTAGDIIDKHFGPSAKDVRDALHPFVNGEIDAKTARANFEDSIDDALSMLDGQAKKAARSRAIGAFKAIAAEVRSQGVLTNAPKGVDRSSAGALAPASPDAVQGDAVGGDAGSLSGERRAIGAVPDAKTDAERGDQRGSGIRAGEDGKAVSAAGEAGASVDIRSFGVPQSAGNPIAAFRNEQPIKRHKDYAAAKSGDVEAAVRLVRDLAPQSNIDAAGKFGRDAIYVPVGAEEASGANALPMALAARYAAGTDGTLESSIVQISRAYHTGASAMERTIARPIFAGSVARSGRYVLVDDVSVMGGTLAELANHIQKNGGEIIGVVTLVNASRTGKLIPDKARVREIERRFGDAVRQELGVEPAALTASESEYLLNFRDADALRNRIAAAKVARDGRLRAKGLLQGEVTYEPGAEGKPQAVVPGAERATPKFSKSESPSSQSAAALRESLSTGKDGKVISRLIDGGHVILHDTIDTLPPSVKSPPYGVVQGVTTQDGKVHLIAGNLSPRRARAVLLHEAFHAGGESLLGSKQWTALLDRVGRAAQMASERALRGEETEHDKFWSEALDQARHAGGPLAEEIAAYTIENYEAAPKGLREIADSIIGAVKAWALRRFGVQMGDMTPAELRSLAVAALRANDTWRNVVGERNRREFSSPSFDAQREEFPSPVQENKTPETKFSQSSMRKNIDRVVEAVTPPLRAAGSRVRVSKSAKSISTYIYVSDEGGLGTKFRISDHDAMAHHEGGDVDYSVSDHWTKTASKILEESGVEIPPELKSVAARRAIYEKRLAAKAAAAEQRFSEERTRAQDRFAIEDRRRAAFLASPAGQKFLAENKRWAENGYKGERPGSIPEAMEKAGWPKDGENGVRYSIRGPLTNTDAFRKWFGNSKVVDAAGEPLVVYHGSSSEIGDDFSFEYGHKGRDESGSVAHFFTPDQYAAETYAREAGFGDTVAVYLQMEKPLDLRTEAGKKAVKEAIEQDGNYGIMSEALSMSSVRNYLERNPRSLSEAPSFWDWLMEATHDQQPNELQNAILDWAKTHYDGVIFQDGNRGIIHDSYAVFEPTQIKSATGNSGAFDPDNPVIRYSIRGPLAKDADANGGLFEAAKTRAGDFLTALMVGAKSSEADAGKVSILSLPPTRGVFLDLARGLPTARTYIDTKQSMDALRNHWQATSAELLREWSNYARANPAENEKLMALMHESTLLQIDPTAAAEKREGSLTAEARDILARFRALSPKGKELYAKARDKYAELADATEAEVNANIERALKNIVSRGEAEAVAELARVDKAGLTGEAREAAVAAAEKKREGSKDRAGRVTAARLKKLRAAFESNRLEGPYFPLARFGNYYVTVRDADGKVVSFSKHEYGPTDALKGKPNPAHVFAEEMRKEHPDWTVDEGLADKLDIGKTVDPRFVGDIDALLEGAEVPEDVRDQIWQRYLQTLPDMSVRKSRIHRKGTAGFSQDAIRAFASHMFHGAHQLARLKYGVDLQEAINQAKIDAKKAKDPVRAAALVKEMELRHNRVMNPSTSQLAQSLTTATFLWTMGANISSALINVEQSITKGIPYVAADREIGAGVAKATAATMNAMWDFSTGWAPGKAWPERPKNVAEMAQFLGDKMGRFSAENSSNLSADEKRAMVAAYDSGLLDRTLAHDIAGVSEAGINYNPFMDRMMRFSSAPMHHTERFNREVTFLAAYRLAREAKMNHDTAFRKATDLTWMTHFDNQVTGRPRLIQSDVARVLTALKSFQANMLWRYGYDFHQSIKGESPEVRREAAGRFWGSVIMTTAAAGVLGAPMASTAFMIAGAVMKMMGDDEDDPEEKLRRAIIKQAGPTMLGRAVAGVMLDGLPGYVTGTSLTGRIGMGDLWFRSHDRDMNTRESFDSYLEDVLGAPVGIARRIFTGADKIIAGDVARGFEDFSPAILRNMMRAGRYATEGVRTKGDYPILTKDKLSRWDIGKTALGFSPAIVAELFDRNTFQKNIQGRIQKKRAEALHDAAVAQMTGKGAAAAQKKVDAFNARHSENPIQFRSVMQSVRGRERTQGRMETGVDLNPKYVDQIRRVTAPSIYR